MLLERMIHLDIFWMGKKSLNNSKKILILTLKEQKENL